MKLDDLSPDLFLTEHGIWQSLRKATVSYPADGNEISFEMEDRSFWFRHRNNCILAIMQSFPFDDTQPIFDVGGGNGYVAKGIQDAGMQSVLIEPGEQGAINAFHRGVQNVICSTLQDANFDSESIAAIGLFDVVEHIENDREFLEDLHALLVDGGKIYITVPAYQWLWSLEDVHAGHFRRHTRSSLGTLLTNTGFEVEYSSYFFAFLPLPILLLRALPYRLKLVKPSTAEDAAKDHNKRKGLLGSLMDRLMEKELQRIKNGKPIAFGGSIILVAQKVGSKD